MKKSFGKIRPARYCKYCGGLINADKVCNECGHVFFKVHFPNRKITFYLLLTYSVLITIILGIYIYQYKHQEIYINDLKDNIEYKENMCNSYSTTISNLKEDIASYEQRIDELSAANSQKKVQLSWYEDHVALYTPHGECYHTISCGYIDNSDLYIVTVQKAEQMGYRPCSSCYSK